MDVVKAICIGQYIIYIFIYIAILFYIYILWSILNKFMNHNNSTQPGTSQLNDINICDIL